MTGEADESNHVPPPFYWGGAASYAAEGEGHTDEFREFQIWNLQAPRLGLPPSGPSGHRPPLAGGGDNTKNMPPPFFGGGAASYAAGGGGPTDEVRGFQIWNVQAPRLGLSPSGQAGPPPGMTGEADESNHVPPPFYGGGAASYAAEGEGHTDEFREFQIWNLQAPRL